MLTTSNLQSIYLPIKLPKNFWGSTTATLHDMLNLYIENISAENIAVTPVGNLSSSNVQDALEELQMDVDSVGSHTHSASDIISGTLSTSRLGSGTANSTTFLRGDSTWQTVASGVSDHGALTGLGDDDHSQYHNDARGDARYYTQTQLDTGELDARYYTESEIDSALATKANSSHSHAAGDITSGIVDTARLGSGTANSSTYLRGDSSWQTVNTYTNEEAQDAVGTILLDTETINFTYDDAAPTIAADVVPNTSIQKIAVAKNNTYVAARKRVNLIEGAGISLTVTDDSGNDEVDITITNSVTSLTLSDVYPIGSIYISTVSTNPGTLFGIGTWSAFGSGKVLVGIDSGQTEFDTVEETGGSKTHTLTESEIPSHTHVQNSHSHNITDSGHTHGQSMRSNNTAGTAGTQGANAANNATVGTTQSSTTGITISSATATNQNTGGGGAHNNLQPYIVVYMWKRTA